MNYCEHSLVHRRWDGDVLVTFCWDCDVELSREYVAPDVSAAPCTHPAKNGQECRACAIARWKVSR